MDESIEQRVMLPEEFFDELLSLTKKYHYDRDDADKIEQSLRCLCEGWQPHKGQLEVLRAVLENRDKQFIYVGCGRKWGKSEMATFLCHLYAYIFPGSEIHYLSSSDELTDRLVWINRRMTTCNTYEYEYQTGIEAVWGKKFKINDAKRTLRFPNGSFIICDGSKNYNYHRGLKPHLIVADEYRDFVPEWIDAVRPNLAVNRGQLVMTTTPPEIPNHCYHMSEYCRKNKFKDAFYIKQPSSKNNRILNFDKWLRNEREKLTEAGKFDVWKREYCAEYIEGGQTVILPQLKSDTLEELLELQRELDEDIDLEYAISLTKDDNNRLFAVFACHNKNNSNVYLLDTFVEIDPSRSTLTECWPKISTIAKKLTIKLDPKSDWQIYFCKSDRRLADTFSELVGTNYVVCEKSDIEKPKKGIDLIREMLTRKFLRISKRCKSIVDENYTTSVRAGDNTFKMPEIPLIKGIKLLLDGFYFTAERLPKPNKVPEDEEFFNRIEKATRLEDFIRRTMAEKYGVLDDTCFWSFDTW